MRISLLISVVSLALAVSSCTTIQHTSSSEAVDTKIYNLTVADMDVSKDKAEKTVNWTWNPLTTFSLSEQKKSATAELLKDVDADVLVEPQYIVNRRGLFRGGSVTVSGYPATYSNFRNMTKEEMAMASAGDHSVVMVNPVVETSASYKYDEPREAKDKSLNHQFVSATFGSVVNTFDAEFDKSFNIGLMYGSYGQAWGWYGRFALAMYKSETRDESGRYTKYDSTELYVPNFTVGFIKTMNKNFNYLMGIGLGGAYYCNSNYWSYRLDGKANELKRAFSVPVELAFQYRTHRLNVLAGFTVSISHDGNLMPFVGAGYSF